MGEVAVQDLQFVEGVASVGMLLVEEQVEVVESLEEAVDHLLPQDANPEEAFHQTDVVEVCRDPARPTEEDAPQSLLAEEIVETGIDLVHPMPDQQGPEGTDLAHLPHPAPAPVIVPPLPALDHLLAHRQGPQDRLLPPDHERKVSEIVGGRLDDERVTVSGFNQLSIRRKLALGDGSSGLMSGLVLVGCALRAMGLLRKQIDGRLIETYLRGHYNTDPVW
jgi:hypothetical protein